MSLAFPDPAPGPHLNEVMTPALGVRGFQYSREYVPRALLHQPSLSKDGSVGCILDRCRVRRHADDDVADVVVRPSRISRTSSMVRPAGIGGVTGLSTVMVDNPPAGLCL